MTDAGQFAGTHPLVAVVFFNIGVAIGAVVTLAIAFFALQLLFARVLGPLLGVIVLSALVGHAAWHGMMNNGGELGSLIGRVPTASLWPALEIVALWLLPAVLIGVIAYFLLKRVDGAPVPRCVGHCSNAVGNRVPRVQHCERARARNLPPVISI